MVNLIGFNSLLELLIINVGMFGILSLVLLDDVLLDDMLWVEFVFVENVVNKGNLI